MGRDASWGQSIATQPRPCERHSVCGNFRRRLWFHDGRWLCASCVAKLGGYLPPSALDEEDR